MSCQHSSRGKCFLALCLPVLIMGYQSVSAGAEPFFALGVEKHRIEPGEGVHQWLTREAWRYFNSQITGAELDDFIGVWEVDGVYGNPERVTVLDGARDEDRPNKPPLWQGTGGEEFDLESPSMRHFCASAADMYTGYFFLVQYHSCMRQAELIWSDNGADNLMMRSQDADKTTAYYYLGHVAHLLQDMTIPAHTHNDPHGSDLPSLHDAYEQDYVPAHFQEYHYEDERGGEPVLAGRPITIPSSLFEAFQVTVDYTDDYDSNHADGAFAKEGLGACFFPEDYPSALLHRPAEALRTGGGAPSTLTEAGCAVVADDLMYWAMKRTAQFFRYYYKETDTATFSARFRLSGTALSADENAPTPYNGPKNTMLSLAYVSGGREGFPPSGILKSSCTLHHDFKPEGGDWVGDQTAPLPLCAGAVALNAGAGVHKIWVTAENGAGNQAVVAPQYFRAAGFGLVNPPVGGLYEVGQTLRLTARVSGAGENVTYEWQKDGVPLAAADSDTLTVTNLQFADAGEYRCVITDTAKESIITPAALVRVAAPNSVSVSGPILMVSLLLLFALAGAVALRRFPAGA